MRKREKQELTYESAVYNEEKMTRELADMIIRSSDVSELKLNTVAIHQKIGGIKILREIIFK